MGLFGNRAEKAEKEAAAAAESERLAGLPVAGLAAEIMPAFGPDGIDDRAGHRRGAIEVTEWLFRDSSTKAKYRQPTLGPVMESLQALENAGLLEGRSFGGSGSGATTYSCTRAGEEALAAGSVSRALGAG
jgi:hypothetical protein